MVLKSLLWSKQLLSMVTTCCGSDLFSAFKDLLQPKLPSSLPLRVLASSSLILLLTD